MHKQSENLDNTLEVPPTSRFDMLAREVQHSDPLGFDNNVEELTIYNETNDVAGLESLLRATTARTLELIPEVNSIEAMACLRDLDFIISSLIAHGVEPLASNSNTEAALVQLGIIANTVPRGTSFTYANGNPPGLRRRTFTNDAQEHIFIDAIADSSAAISQALEILTTHTTRKDITPLTRAVERVTASMVSVKRSVTPEFFTGQLRYYLELYSVNGNEYLGPGGIQTLLPVDLIVWGIDSTDNAWKKFVETNYPYIDPIQKEHLQDILKRNHGESFYEKARTSSDIQLQREVYYCLKALKKFRYPHRKLVQDNVEIAEDDSYDDSIVGVILRKTDALLLELGNTGNID